MIAREPGKIAAPSLWKALHTTVARGVPPNNFPVITLTVNGESRQFQDALNCAGLIETLGLAGKRIALECNGEIVPRGRHAEHALADGDKIEIVVAVGGG